MTNHKLAYQAPETDLLEIGISEGLLVISGGGGIKNVDEEDYGLL